MQTINSSPEAKAFIEDYKENETIPHCEESPRSKYPIANLSVGKSLRWEDDDKKWNAVRQFAFQWNKINSESGKKLKAFRHDKYKCIELARIA